MDEIGDDLGNALENFLGHDDKPIVDKFSLILSNDTRPITKENFPTFSEERLK